MVSDLSNIESRVLAWLAGERWKIQAFREYDNGTGHDLYKLSYSKSFGVNPEYVTKEQRQIGKVQELALGYEGGVGTFITFSMAYGIDSDTMADIAIKNVDLRILDEAKSAYYWALKNKRTYGLTEKAYEVCDAFRRSWRTAPLNIVELWKKLDSGLRIVIDGHVGCVWINDKLLIDRKGAWLRIRLPSGRYLCYPSARIDENGKISYMGQNTYSRKWKRINTYGGKIAENITQAVARDMMGWAMHCIDEMGFNIVLTVHDEINTECPDGSE